MQQPMVIFNPLTDSSQNVSCSALLWSVCVCKIWILYENSLRPSWRILKIDVLEMSVSCERRRVDFLGDSSRLSRKFWVFSGIMAERCQPLWPLWASTTLPSLEILLQSVELSFYQVHCSCQNLSCIATVSEELILWQSTPIWFLSTAA